jgi:hypothetical protein
MTWLDPEDVVAAVDFLVPQPAYVNLQQITIVPTRRPPDGMTSCARSCSVRSPDSRDVGQSVGESVCEVLDGGADALVQVPRFRVQGDDVGPGGGQIRQDLDE